MIVVTTIATGFFAGLLRSVPALALIAFLIVAVFAAAALTGPVSALSFGLAVLGYNFGVGLYLVAQIMLSDRSSSPHSQG